MRVRFLTILLLVFLLVSLVGCTPSVAPAPTAEVELPTGSISWDEAKNHIGETATVCGLVVDTKWATGSEGKPTFLNIGKPYPDKNRFTVVIWQYYRKNFDELPEKYYLNKTICVEGQITEYGGTPQIEVKYQSQIKILGD